MVDVVCVPEVPVTVIVDVPAATVLAAVSVRTLDEVAGLVAKAAVTPVGSPVAANVTAPLNEPVSVMLMVAGPLEPAAMDSVGTAGVSTKFAVPEPAVTVRAIVVEAVSVPEVPVIVMVLVPVVAVLATARISPLVPVVGLASIAAVTPVGRPETASVTAPVNPFASSTLMVSLMLVPGAVDSVTTVAQSEKLPDVEVTVSEMVMVFTTVPEVQVMVMGYVPATVVLPASTVRMLEVVNGLVPNTTVTPLGKPDTTQEMLPVNPFRSVAVMVSVPLEPAARESEAAEGATVKLGVPVTVSAMVMVELSVPEVPVMVIVEVPATAVLATVKVTTLVPVVGLVAKAAVTPVGNPDTARVTAPANGLTSVTVIVSVPVAP